MKHFYLFLLLIPFTFTFGQNIAQNGGMEQWTNDVLDVWTSEVGTEITPETSLVSEGSFAANFHVVTASQGDTDFRQTIQVEIGKTYNVSVDVYQLDNTSKARIFATEYGTYSDPEIVNEWQTITFEFTAAEAGDAEVGLRFYDVQDLFDEAVGSHIIVDNFVVTCVDCGSTDPELFITSPSEGEALSAGTTETTVEFVVNNFEVGTDGHIHYTLNDNDPVMVYSTDPITLSNLTTGMHTLTMWLVDTNHNALDPEVTATVNFSIPGENEVSSIAELRAGATDGSVYTLSSEAVLTMQQDFRNQKWIQDDTGAILIDDNNGVITTAYNQYDGITGLQGTLSEFRGVKQFIPTADAGEATSSNNVITPVVVTVSDFNANPDAYESQVIKIEYLTTTATGDWETGTNYDFVETASGETILVRTNFYDANYIGSAIPNEPVHLVGIASEFNGTAQIFPRDSDDIITNLGVDNVAIDASMVKVAVSNNELVIAGFDAKQIAIYSIQGKLVSTSTAVGKLPLGTYIAVMKNAEGQTINVKFIKK